MFKMILKTSAKQRRCTSYTKCIMGYGGIAQTIPRVRFGNESRGKKAHLATMVIQLKIAKKAYQMVFQAIDN